MTEVAYQLVDVFTDRPFGGNPLAVVPDATGLGADAMQRIAQELNLSETTFVLQPDDPEHDFRVRIFTPSVEMPMAGHPTIGTAWVLAKLGAIARGREGVVFEEGGGSVPVEIAWRGDAPGRCTMQQLPPEVGPEFRNREALAAMLGLEPEVLVSAAPGIVISCGVPYLIVELADLASTKAARLRLDIWERELTGFATEQLLVYTRECETHVADAHMRMFAPGLGVPEDPATGSAAGPLGCHLAGASELAGRPLLFEQGFELGRPSFLHVEVELAEGQLGRVRVGGDCVAMGRGVLVWEGGGR